MAMTREISCGKRSKPRFSNKRQNEKNKNWHFFLHEIRLNGQTSKNLFEKWKFPEENQALNWNGWLYADLQLQHHDFVHELLTNIWFFKPKIKRRRIEMKNCDFANQTRMISGRFICNELTSSRFETLSLSLDSTRWFQNSIRFMLNIIKNQIYAKNNAFLPNSFSLRKYLPKNSNSPNSELFKIKKFAFISSVLMVDLWEKPKKIQNTEFLAIHTLYTARRIQSSTSIRFHVTQRTKSRIAVPRRFIWNGIRAECIRTTFDSDKWQYDGNRNG